MGKVEMIEKVKNVTNKLNETEHNWTEITERKKTNDIIKTLKFLF